MQFFLMDCKELGTSGRFSYHIEITPPQMKNRNLRMDSYPRIYAPSAAKDGEGQGDLDEIYGCWTKNKGGPPKWMVYFMENPIF